VAGRRLAVHAPWPSLAEPRSGTQWTTSTTTEDARREQLLVPGTAARMTRRRACAKARERWRTRRSLAPTHRERTAGRGRPTPRLRLCVRLQAPRERRRRQVLCIAQRESAAPRVCIVHHAADAGGDRWLQGRLPRVRQRQASLMTRGRATHSSYPWPSRGRAVAHWMEPILRDEGICDGTQSPAYCVPISAAPQRHTATPYAPSAVTDGSLLPAHATITLRQHPLNCAGAAQVWNDRYLGAAAGAGGNGTKTNGGGAVPNDLGSRREHERHHWCVLASAVARPQGWLGTGLRVGCYAVHGESGGGIWSFGAWSGLRKRPCMPLRWARVWALPPFSASGRGVRR
jgi:hypothetical protein